MADQKISELTALTGANVADDDAIAIVDTSATETKKIVFSELKNALDTATGFVRITGDTMTGDLTVPNVVVSGNVDGRDVSVDGTKLDGIAAGANVGIPATGGTMTGNLSMGDNNKIIMGAGSDLQLYHDGSSSIIYDSGTGNLQLTSSGTGVDIQKAGGEKMATFVIDGASTLYYDNAAKLATTSTGIAVTGGVYLGGTGSANKLDDYEEGTWTLGVTIGGSAQTLSGPVATYTKFGNTVSIRLRVSFNKSGSGVVNITGLPFASASGATVSVPIGCQVGSVTSTAGLFANIDNSTTIVHLADQAGDLTDADLASTAVIFSSFTYQA